MTLLRFAKFSQLTKIISIVLALTCSITSLGARQNLSKTIPFKASEYLKYKYQYKNVIEESAYHGYLASTFCWVFALGTCLTNTVWVGIEGNIGLAMTFSTFTLCSWIALCINFKAYTIKNDALRYRAIRATEKMFTRKVFLARYLSPDTLKKIDDLGYKKKDIDLLIILLRSLGYDCSRVRGSIQTV